MKRKILSFFIIAFGLIFFDSFTLLAANDTKKKYTILIDPGHGGDDFGAKSLFSDPLNPHESMEIFEKYVTLDISKKIAVELKKDFHVYLTRSIDRTLSLEQRAQMAESVGADLYISVHANANAKEHSRGLETYYLDNHQDIAIKKIEKIENPHLEGQDLMTNKILIDLLVQRMAPDSKRLAHFVHQSLTKDVAPLFKMPDRGIRPGLFYVLALSKRPAILLEAGFLTNNLDRRKLMSPKFQQYYANAVGNGVRKYFSSKERN
jgi:N-acetylmuramoyl-L-alanine amidase